MAKETRLPGCEDCAPLGRLIQIRCKKQDASSQHTKSQERININYRKQLKSLKNRYSTGTRQATDQYTKEMESLSSEETRNGRELIDDFIQNPTKYSSLYNLAVGFAYGEWTLCRTKGNYANERACAKKVIDVHRAEGRNDIALDFAQRIIDDAASSSEKAARQLKKEKNRKEKKRLKAEIAAYERTEQDFLDTAQSIEDCSRDCNRLLVENGLEEKADE